MESGRISGVVVVGLVGIASRGVDTNPLRGDIQVQLKTDANIISEPIAPRELLRWAVFVLGDIKHVGGYLT